MGEDLYRSTGGRRARVGAMTAIGLIALALLVSPCALAAKVPPSLTSTTLQESASSAGYGSEQAVVFTATVTAGNESKPSGKGSVLNGKKKVCALVITNGVGTCSPKAKGLKTGSYSLLAEFKKSSKFAGSSSNAVNFAVGNAPETTITSAPSGKVKSGEAEISFTSNEPLGSFQCSLDGGAFTPCMSSHPVDVGPGKHEFKVRAISASGIADPTPASATWESVGQAPLLKLCGEASPNTRLAPEDAAVYVLECPLIIPSGTTMTVAPGTILKARGNAYIQVEGSLLASGTAEKPVTLTSWRDDSVGGDTNGDGNATAPAAGDWSGIATSSPGNGNPNPTLSLEHTIVNYASRAIEATRATTSVTNSSVGHSSGEGIYVSQPEGVPTIKNNAVTYAAGHAISIYSASIDMGALNGNSGSNDELNGVALGNDTVTVSSSLPWSGNLPPVLVSGCSSLTVPAKVTLTLGAGTIVKSEYCSYIQVEGSLVASGTAEKPVTLTSWRDDSVGGDTNGDGNATAPAAGDWSGIATSSPGNGNPNPTLSLEHTIVNYASRAIEATRATTSVTNSSVGHSSGEGIYVSQPEGVPTIKNNAVTYAAGHAISIYNASIDMGALNGNSGSNDELNGVALGNDTVTVSSSLPWSGNLPPVLVSGCSSLTVPAKVTLTLGAGTIVKSEYCSYIQVEGSLVASGTAEKPVTLTSWRDDSVGGDTNGDGNATAPAAGDWSGIATSSPGNGNPNPTLSLEHTIVNYASRAIEATRATTSVTNSSVGHSSGEGIYVSQPEGVPTIKNNAVTYAAGHAISIYNASIDMGALNGNSGSNDELNGVALGNDTVTVSSSLPWSGNLPPVLVSGCSSLTVPAKVTLTLGAGTIVKSEYCSYIQVEGSLVASGTAEKPVTLTSWRDDSVGGDTNGDGNATAPAAGDWSGIATSSPGNGNPNPTLSLEHTIVNYASRAIEATRATTSVTNSSVGHSSGEGIYVSQPEGVPTIKNNAVTYAAGHAISIYNASIDMGALNGNSGSNDELNGVALGNDTVTVSSSLPWSGNLPPVLVSGCSSLTVPAKVTLTLGAGTIVKSEYCSYIQVEGSLVASGTAEKPVTLTSWRDDSVGGDTNGDGNATAPAAGDWSGIVLASGGSATLLGTAIRYAGIGLNVAEGDEATIHGAILNSTVGISSNTYVDATEVNWGNSSGPGPEGAGTVVEGTAVNVTPWVGYVAPPKPTPPPPPPPVKTTCPTILFIGARGSGEPASSGYKEPLTDVGARVAGVYRAFESEIETYNASHNKTPQRLEIRGLQYPAASTDELKHFAFVQYFESVWDGAFGLESMLEAEEGRCPNAKIVLSGYSQGALAIHLALAEEAGTQEVAPKYLAAVLFIADPAKTGGNEVINVGTAKASADGIYTKIFGTSVGPLATPSNLSKRTESLCKNHDIVCAPGFGATIGNHEGYSSDELESLGAWGAQEELAGN